MNSQVKPRKKSVLTADKAALAAEWAADLPARSEQAAELAAQLHSFSAAERETFVALLIARAGDSAFPLLEALRGKDEALDVALVRGSGHVASTRAVEFLVRWGGEHPPKRALKEIRKSLFRLQSKGLRVPDIGDPSPRIFHPPKAEPSEGFVSAVDPGGSRAVWLGLPLPPQGLIFISGILSDTEGVLDFTLYESSRKKFHEFMDQTRSDSPLDIVECDPNYCRALIHEAHEIQVKRGKAPNPDYLKFRGLGSPPLPSPLRPLIYRFISEEEIKSRPDLLDRAPSLFETAAFEAWFLEKAEIEKCLGLLEEAGRSRIILAPHQQEGRFFEIYRQTVRELFDENRCRLFRRRLEEMAYVLWMKGDEDRARVSVAAALALSAEERMLAPHPFLLELVKRTALFVKEEERREKVKEKEGGVILQP
jgi:hypothetical protein